MKVKKPNKKRNQIKKASKMYRSFFGYGSFHKLDIPTNRATKYIYLLCQLFLENVKEIISLLYFPSPKFHDIKKVKVQDTFSRIF